MSEMNKEGKLRRFYKNHPQFRRMFDRISVLVDYCQKMSWIIVAIVIIAIVLLLYVELPSSVREPISLAVGGILTAFAFPSVIANKRIRYDNNMNKIEKCTQFHEQMTRMLIDLLNTQTQSQQREIARRIIDHIADYYNLTCIYCTQSQLDILYFIRCECKMIYNFKEDGRASIDTLHYMAEKYLRSIRKQGFTSGKAYFCDPISQSSEVQK